MSRHGGYDHRMVGILFIVLIVLLVVLVATRI